MKNSLDTEAIIYKIRNVEEASLKPLTDIVALKISKGPLDGGPENNLSQAEEITAEYISENYRTFDEFHQKLTALNGGVKGIEALADKIYQRYISSDHLDFETVKNNISSNKDITLKTITDLVAYKISESAADQGPDLNFISAETFVAEFVSKNFKNKKELENKISKLGNDMKGLSAFADRVYKHFVSKKT